MKKALLITALIIGFAVFILSMLVMHAKPEAPANPMPTRDKLVRDHSPILGSPAAPVVIVEFLDPACGTCRDFYPLVKSLLADSAGQVSLIIRYAPFHVGADRIVMLLDAARRQGQFWPVLDTLMATQDTWVIQHRPQLELAMAELRKTSLSLDWARLERDMNSPEAHAIVKQDLADASALLISKTPEFIVNGRPLQTFGWEPLKKLVAEELQKVHAR
ncbi:MAG: thioredoxin domain-containing protein [Burkholderiales bacterium]|nr:thioredoxin domain-containing protein [Burkholderiales bacterium]